MSVIATKALGKIGEVMDVRGNLNRVINTSLDLEQYIYEFELLMKKWNIVAIQEDIGYKEIKTFLATFVFVLEECKQQSNLPIINEVRLSDAEKKSIASKLESSFPLIERPIVNKTLKTFSELSFDHELNIAQTELIETLFFRVYGMAIELTYDESLFKRNEGKAPKIAYSWNASNLAFKGISKDFSMKA